MAHNFALVGNPNCGKTTLFNQLTGSNQKVGNWPGVTVEKKVGQIKKQGDVINITDLPGIYSLSPYSLEEVITSEYILSGESDLIINIIDATTIERSLFLTTQLMETGVPIVIALNMMDVIEKDGGFVDIELLEKEFGIPVVPISASRGYGVEDIIPIALHTIHDIHYHGAYHGHHERHGHAEPHKPTEHGAHTKPYAEFDSLQIKSIYGANIKAILDNLERLLADVPHAQWMAVRYFEEGESCLKNFTVSPETLKKLSLAMADFEKNNTIDRDMVLPDGRYSFICSIVEKVVRRAKKEHELSATDKIDKIITNRVLAIPIFLIIMLGIFYISFGQIGSTVKEWWEDFLLGYIFGGISNVLEALNAPDWMTSLFNDGIIAGVGSVLSFLPEIALLFLFLTLLEASGYMSRAAFIMDRLFRKFGLSGKSFVPMLMGFGCTVPAIMAARTLENERERRLTIMITPFISCSARLPVYAIFAGAFFAERQPIVIFSLYIMGIAVSVISGFILKGFVAKGQQSNFVMELPAYRMPSVKRLARDTWDRVNDFIIRAGTVILTASVIVWILQTFNFKLQMVENSGESMFASIGRIIAPFFAPLGFGNWKAAVSLLTGFIAKEAVVGSLGILYDVGDTALSQPELLSNALAADFNTASSYAFMVFTLLYLPCVAALSTMKQELNSWKWTLLTVAYQIGVAWIMAFFAYHAALWFLL